MSEITQKVIESHGFTAEEYEKILDIMGRVPNMTELGIFSVMWSEHCSYKSSKKMAQNPTNKSPLGDLWTRRKRRRH